MYGCLETGCLKGKEEEMNDFKDVLLHVQFGATHKNRDYYIPLMEMFYVAGEKFGLSKSEIKRMNEQNGIKISLVKGKIQK